MPNKQNLPNLITVARGVLTLFIIALFFIPVPGRFWWIYILFVFASLSDYFDGYLARKWGAVSDFGKLFDPLFDKILTLSLFFLLSGFVSWGLALVFILLLLRDLAVDNAKSFLMAKNVVTQAIYSAKLKMVSQVVMLNFVLLWLIWPDEGWLTGLAHLSGWLAVFFSYWSGIAYLKKFNKSLTTTSDGQKI